MKRLRYVLYTLLTLCLFFQTAIPASAKGEEYTYTIRFFAGQQGTFTNGEEVIVIPNCSYGERVNFYQSSVKLNDNSKYYIRGIRESGKDNSESTQSSSFLVTEDQDYVIAYGILGDATSYTINYVDGDGNTLAPSETYYGNVGDQPVVAYVYIEGWQPQAYNMTQTLEKDPAENVFTFVYTRIPEPTAPAPAPAPEPVTPPAPETPDAEAPADTGIVVIPAPADDGAPDDGGADDGGAADDGGGPDDAETPDDGGEENLPDEEPPLGAPDEIVNLDDDEVPTSNFLSVAADARLLGIPIPVIIVLALGAVGAAWYFLIMKKKKKKEEEPKS